MKGTIHVLTAQGEILVDKQFVSRMQYTFLLAELMETFREHRIEITFEIENVM